MRRLLQFLPIAFLFRVSFSTDHSAHSSQLIDVDLLNLDIDEIHRQITQKRVHCVDLTRFFLARIEKYNPILNAFITVDEIGSLRDASRLDYFYKKTGGKLKGRLHCVPAIIKDNIFVKGLPTTLGVRLFSNATADQDAPVVARLRREGAIVLGKANMIMFAAGSTDVPSETGGLAKNPYALNYTVVGSSTGNAVALSSRLAVIALGSDSGGSITAPSSTTNVVGLRPSSGSVDMREVFPLLGQPFDTVGPMALTAKDVTTVFDILQIGSNEKSIRSDRSTIRIGILHSLAYGTINVSVPLIDSPGYFSTSTYSVDPEVQTCFRSFQQRLGLLSKHHDLISTVIMDDIIDLSSPVMENENNRWSCVMSDMTRFLKRHPMRSSTGESIDNAENIATHQSTPASYQMLFQFLDKQSNQCTASRQLYANNLITVRRLLRRKIFDQEIDIVAMPTLNSLPWPLLDQSNSSDNEQYNADAYGHLYDFGGLFALPTMNLPLCFSKPRPGAVQGLPIGGYLMTIPDRVKKMLQFAEIYEKAFRQPQMSLYLGKRLFRA